ncbi:MAG: hypothetical protein GXO83_06780 [Chlorobi bacterium]|nr:hypothetical protein [Chlorobiota bacterium]
MRDKRLVREVSGLEREVSQEAHRNKLRSTKSLTGNRQTGVSLFKGHGKPAGNPKGRNAGGPIQENRGKVRIFEKCASKGGTERMTGNGHSDGFHSRIIGLRPGVQEPFKEPRWQI